MSEQKKPIIMSAIELQDLAVLEFPEDATAEQIAEIEAAWEKAMDETLGDLREGMTRIRKAIERETFKAEQHDPEINLLKRELELRTAGKARHEAHVTRLKRYATKCLQIAGGEVEAEGFVFKLQKNGGTPKVEIADREQIPEKYRVPQPWQPDTKLIGIDVEKGGAAVPGAVVSRGVHLRIKGA
jgi:hypothetical protein